MKVPDVDIKKLKEFREKNFEERLEFIRKYAEWVRKTSNKKWSSQQKKLIG